VATGTVDPGSGGAACDVVIRWRLRVDAAACIGSGSCAGIAPRHFRLDGPTATPVSESVLPDDDVLAAADSCPAEAITVVPVPQ
jgi:ferredoxin